MPSQKITSMKLLRIPILILLLTALPTFARLGETKAECEKRYGKVFMTLDGGTEIFKKADLEIRISYLDGKASSIGYQRYMTSRDVEKKKPKDLTEAELAVLLEANRGNSEWKKDEASDHKLISWRRADGGASAAYFVSLGDLSITTKAYSDHRANERKKDEVEKAKKEAKKLEGF